MLLVLPLGLMAFVSTLERGADGGVVWLRHTLDAYAQFLFERDLIDNLVMNTDYLQIFARSIGLAAMTARSRSSRLSDRALDGLPAAVGRTFCSSS